jgi:hypothetical protein
VVRYPISDRTYRKLAGGELVTDAYDTQRNLARPPLARLESEVERTRIEAISAG